MLGARTEACSILRDRDHTSCGEGCDPRLAASDGTLEERRYFCQNWRADVVAITKSDGTPIEYVRYSPYGEPTVYPVADLNMDGVVNSTDSSLWSDLLYSTSNSSVYHGSAKSMSLGSQRVPMEILEGLRARRPGTKKAPSTVPGA